MAAGISSAGQVQEILQIAKRRVWGVFLPAVLTGSLGIMAGSLLPAKYTAETRMELGVVPKPLMDAGLDANRLRDEMRAASFNLSTFSRMDQILSGLEWEHYDVLPPDERREFVRKLLLDMWIKVEHLEGTNVHFMIFGYRDTDPQRAAQFANYIRDHFVDDLVENARAKAKAELERLTKDYRAADDDYEEVSTRLQDLKREHGISPTLQVGQQATREIERDPVWVMLQDQEAEKVQVEKKLDAARVKLTGLRARRQAMPLKVDESDFELSGTDTGAAIELLREQINDARIRQAGKKEAHSDWIRAQHDIDLYEEQIALLEGKTVEAKRIVSTKPNPDIPEIDAEIEDLEIAILEDEAYLANIERQIKDLQPRVQNRTQVYHDLQREVDRLDLLGKMRTLHMYNSETQRQLVASLSTPGFSPFEISQEALPPIKPSSPSALIVVAAGFVLGIGMGVVYALVAEFGRNGFRGPNDLARGLPAPVLGAINEIVTVRDRRQRALRQTLVGAATLILSASILWVTWAFHSRPSLLGPELMSWLDQMRGSLR